MAPLAWAHAAIRGTSLIVPSEFETKFVATILGCESRAISSSASYCSSPESVSGSVRKLAPVRFATYCHGT